MKLRTMQNVSLAGFQSTNDFTDLDSSGLKYYLSLIHGRNYVGSVEFIYVALTAEV